jgi:hypothetical protein
MNKKVLLSTVVLIICQFMNCDCYVILEPEKTGESLNSFVEHKQLDNALDSTYSAKVSEMRALIGNQTQTSTLFKPNQLSAKKANQKQKSCSSCNSDKIPMTVTEEQNRQRTEYIKQQILFKLGMNKAPKLNNRNIDTTACNSCLYY